MPRTTKPVARAAIASPAAQPPTKWPARKSSERGATLTHERLDEQLEAFRKAGGKIEVLGTTRSLRNIDVPQETKSASSVAASAPKRSR